MALCVSFLTHPGKHALLSTEVCLALVCSLVHSILSSYGFFADFLGDNYYLGSFN
jgi:hypothetical protein